MADRTYDLSIFSGATVGGSAQVALAFSQNEVVTGIQKLAQEFTMNFLTMKGTRVHDLRYGTDFVTKLNQGALRATNVETAFTAAVLDILNYQKRWADTDTPSDELLAGAELLAFSFPTLNSLSMTVRLTSQAGGAREVIMATPLVSR